MRECPRPRLRAEAKQSAALATISCSVPAFLQSPFRQTPRMSGAPSQPTSFDGGRSAGPSSSAFRQRADKREKLIASIGVAFEHVEGRGAWGKKNHFPGFCAGMCTLDRVGKRGCDLGFDRASPGAPDALGHFADQNCGFDLFLYERSKRIKAKTLVLAAGDQDDWLGLRS